METRLVRLKPRGHRVKQYSAAGLRFKLGGDFVRVSLDIADRLAQVRESNTDPDSRRIFEIKTEEEAAATAEVERTEAEPKPPEAQPVQLARTDVPPEDELAIVGYRSLTAREIARKVERGQFSVRDLEELRLFEQAHANRVTVKRAIDAKLEG